MEFNYTGHLPSDVADVANELDTRIGNYWTFGYKRIKDNYNTAMIDHSFYKTKKEFEEKKKEFCEIMRTDMRVSDIDYALTWRMGTDYELALILVWIIKKKQLSGNTYFVYSDEDKLLSSVYVIADINSKTICFKPDASRNRCDITVKDNFNDLMKLSKFKNMDVYKCKFDYSGMTLKEIRSRLDE